MYFRYKFESINLNDLNKIKEIRNYYIQRNQVPEIIRAWLYYCNYLYELQILGYKEEIDLLVEYILNNEGKFFNYEEWIFAENLFRYINSYYDDILGSLNKEIKLITLDKEEIIANDKKIIVPLKKTMEVLVFIYINKRADLKTIVYNVFQEYDYDRAKTIFIKSNM